MCAIVCAILCAIMTNTCVLYVALDNDVKTAAALYATAQFENVVEKMVKTEKVEKVEKMEKREKRVWIIVPSGCWPVHLWNDIGCVVRVAHGTAAEMVTAAIATLQRHYTNGGESFDRVVLTCVTANQQATCITTPAALFCTLLNRHSDLAAMMMKLTTWEYEPAQDPCRVLPIAPPSPSVLILVPDGSTHPQMLWKPSFAHPVFETVHFGSSIVSTYDYVAKWNGDHDIRYPVPCQTAKTILDDTWATMQNRTEIDFCHQKTNNSMIVKML